jgi:hypothetical protein
LTLSSGGTQRDFVRDPVKVAGDFGALLVGRGIGVFVSAARRVNSEHALGEIAQAAGDIGVIHRNLG